MPTDYWEVVGSLTFPSCIRKPSEVHDVDIVVYDDDKDTLNKIVDSGTFGDDMYPEDFKVKHGKLILDVKHSHSKDIVPVTVIQKPFDEFTGTNSSVDFYHIGLEENIYWLKDIYVGSIENAMLAKASYLEKGGGKAAYRKKHSQDLQNYFRWKTGEFDKTIKDKW